MFARRIPRQNQDRRSEARRYNSNSRRASKVMQRCCVSIVGL
jgi:hypothetical protein